MKKMLSAALFPLIFYACSSSVHLPVPGEDSVKVNNIYIEYMSLGDSYMDLGKYDKAVEYYSYARQNKDLYWTAYYKMGRAYAFAKNYKQARKVYNRLLKRDRSNLELQTSIAYLYAMEGNVSAAVSIYEYLEGQNKENADVLVNFINVLFADGQNDYAKIKLAELKERFPDNTSIAAFDKKIAEIDGTNLDDDSEDEAAPEGGAEAASGDASAASS